MEIEHPLHLHNFWRKELQQFPKEGILLHGTSSHRAELILKHGFNPQMAQGDTLNPYTNYFYFFNPDPNLVSRDSIWFLKGKLESLINYAQMATLNDLFEGDNYPVIIALKTPAETIISDEEQEWAKSTFVQITHSEKFQSNPKIAIFDLRKRIGSSVTPTGKRLHTVSTELWNQVKNELISEPQLPEEV